MGLFRAVFICAAIGLIFGTAHGSGSSTDVLVKIPGDTVVFNVTRDPATPYTHLTWEILLDSSFSLIIITANQSTVNVIPTYEDRVTLFDDGSLELRDLKLYESRYYRVNITSAEGPEVSTVYRLFVQEPVSNVTFSPSNTHLNEMGTAILRCSASGSDLKFSFYNTTHTFPASNGYLAFHDITRNHTGPWGCEAYNLVSKAKSQNEITFSIRYGPDEVTVEAFPSLDVYPVGSKVTLRCTAVGSNPEADISWTHNSIEASELELGPLKYEDRGFYDCKAYNRITYKSVKGFAYIAVEYVPEKPLSGGAIAGIFIACAVVGIGTSAVVFYLTYRKK